MKKPSSSHVGANNPGNGRGTPLNKTVGIVLMALVHGGAMEKKNLQCGICKKL